uniref:hypothetical protein n=1 Tax=Nocardia brasiliensis TaxID=37326 RepID=UPI002458099D
MKSDRVIRRFTPDAQETRVYGEPYETADGSTIVTVVRPGGGPRAAAPRGILVVHDGQGKWEPGGGTPRLGRFLFPLVTSLILMLLIWYVFLQAFPQVGPRVGKSPEDIWRYLV